MWTIVPRPDDSYEILDTHTMRGYIIYVSREEYYNATEIKGFITMEEVSTLVYKLNLADKVLKLQEQQRKVN
jgi:hypothetical protein